MYIGLDLGTSGLKGVLIGEDQSVLAEATAPLTVQRPAEGWSEQAPSDWISAAETVFDRLAAQKSLGQVRGIGLSGHMHGATLLDARDEVLRPCILWNDTRSHEEAAELDGDPMFRRLTGNIVFPGFTAPKLVWVARHEPAIRERVDYVPGSTEVHTRAGEVWEARAGVCQDLVHLVPRVEPRERRGAQPHGREQAQQQPREARLQRGTGEARRGRAHRSGSVFSST